MLKMKLLVILLFVTAAKCQQETQEEYTPEEKRVRDPFIPSHYDLQLRLVGSDEFEGYKNSAIGRVHIVGVNVAESNQIKLEAADFVKINNATITVKSIKTQKQLEIGNITREQYSIEMNFTSLLAAGEEVELFMDFVSRIQENCEHDRWGICKDAADKYGATFSSRLAWNMFPCIDEDRIHSTFNLTLIRKDEFNNTISNGPKLTQTPDPKHAGWTIDTFAKTQPSEASQLRFMVSKYAFIENLFGAEPHRRSLKVHAPLDELNKDEGRQFYTKLANITHTMLSVADNYFQDPKTVPKFDFVMMPHHNIESQDVWGLYFENAYDRLPDFPSRKLHHAVFTLMRILPRQWLGTYKPVVHHHKEDYDSHLDYGLTDFLKYIVLKPVEVERANLRIVQDKRDAMEGGCSQNIIDKKWAAIFRMFEGFLTKETMRKGLVNFAKGGDISRSKLTASLQNAADEDGTLKTFNTTINQTLDSWLTKCGYPIVKVNLLNDTHVEIAQQAVANKTWNVPIVVNRRGQPDKVVLLAEQDKLILEHNATQTVIINPEARGMYKSLYDDKLSKLIELQLINNFKAFDQLTRYQLLSDYTHFAKNDFFNYSTTLNLMKYITNETESIVIDEFASLLSHLHRKFLFTPEKHSLLLEYASPKLTTLWTRVKDSAKDKIFTGDVTSDDYEKTELDVFACQLGEKVCVDWANRHIKKWKDDGQFISALDSTPSWKTGAMEDMLCGIIASGDKKEFQYVLDQYRTLTNESNEKLCTKLMETLACSPDVDLLKKLLEESWSFKHLNHIGVFQLLKALAGKTTGEKLVLPYLETNFERINNATDYPARGVWAFSDIIQRLAEHYTTSEQLKQLEDFISKHEQDLTVISEDLEKSVNMVKENVKWMDNQGQQVVKWLKEQQ